LDNIISILVPLVLILAILLPRLLRSKSTTQSGSRATKPKPPAGLLDVINRKLEELAAAERAQSSPGPDDEDDNPWSKDDEPETEAGSDKTIAPPVASAANPEPTTTAMPVDQNRAEPVTLRKDAQVKIPATLLPEPSADTQISREELRRAIVWSEILAPPLALRKPEP
jgi:hypothetical protein